MFSKPAGSCPLVASGGSAGSCQSSRQNNEATMRLPKAILSGTLALLACGISSTAMRAAEASERGDWTLSKSDLPGVVRFSVIQSNHNGTFQSSSDWRASDFEGLDLSQSGRHEVRFKVSRDAGRFECDGFLDDGEGTGLFHFFGNPDYPREMAAIGFSGVDPMKQMSMAI